MAKSICECEHNNIAISHPFTIQILIHLILHIYVYFSSSSFPFFTCIVLSLLISRKSQCIYRLHNYLNLLFFHLKTIHCLQPQIFCLHAQMQQQQTVIDWKYLKIGINFFIIFWIEDKKTHLENKIFAWLYLFPFRYCDIHIFNHRLYYILSFCTPYQ